VPGRAPDAIIHLHLLIAPAKNVTLPRSVGSRAHVAVYVGSGVVLEGWPRAPERRA
jgi:hypothetical protein